MILPYLKYFLKAGDEHALHSPFLFDYYRRIIVPKNDNHPDYATIATARNQMRNSTQVIETVDLGAGSRVNKSNLRKVSQIAKNAEKPPRFGKLFYRMVREQQSKTVLELGTSLGITTMYFAKANPQASIYTFEGCPYTAAIAKENFQQQAIDNVEIITGNIDDTLVPFLTQLNKPLDLAYFDANHRYEPTVRYFKQCLPYIHEDTIFIFDDIYWSKEMTQAWEEIKQHPDITVTLDLFWIGIVFFRKKQLKQDFVLKF